MERRTALWTAFITASILKWIGATWDMAWHFRQVNDAGSPAHMINLVGNVVLGVALIIAWRTRQDEEKTALKIIGAGIVMALAAAPLDQLWHEVNGLDLTTWSPTHLLLFSGTAVMGIGFVALWLAHLGWRPGDRLRGMEVSRGGWLLLAFLMFRVFSIVLFPVAFNEYTAVAAENTAAGYTIYPVAQELKDFAAGVADLPYDDLPHALYPAYSLVVTMAMVVVVRRLTQVPFLPTAIAAFYVLTRVVSDSILGATGWPVAAIPYDHVFAVAAADAVLLLPIRRPAVSASLAGAAATLASYAYWGLAPAVVPYVVPFDAATIPWALVAAVVAAMAATMSPWTWRKGGDETPAPQTGPGTDTS